MGQGLDERYRSLGEVENEEAKTGMKKSEEERRQSNNFKEAVGCLSAVCSGSSMAKK